MDGMAESESIDDDCCSGDDTKGRRTLIDQRILTLAEIGNCSLMRFFSHLVAVDGLITLDSSRNIWEMTRASDDHGSLSCTAIAC